jgi:hypothetical protein
MGSKHHDLMALVRPLLICGCVLILVLVGACTARPPVQKPPAATKDEPYDFKTEGNIPPLKDADVVREVDFEEVPVTEEDMQEEDVEISPGESVGAKLEPEFEQAPGFRVQVFATGNQETAEAVREAAHNKLGVAVYSELVEGLYKVRIGDCPDREQAERLLERCRAAGYGDAWIVETQVRVPRIK